MVDELTKLYNTMKLIETKGDSTKAMADCLRFLEQMIVDERNAEALAQSAPEGE